MSQTSRVASLFLKHASLSKIPNSGEMKECFLARCLGILLVTVACLPCVSFAQPLMEAVEAARFHDARVRAMRAEFLAIQTSIDQAKAGFLPIVRLEFDRMETEQRTLSSQSSITTSPVNRYPTKARTLSISQPIYRKEASERMVQAEAGVRQANYLLRAAEQDLLLRTATAYLVLMASKDSQALAKAERETVGKALDSAKERLRAGVGNIVNQLDAQARFAVTQAREIEADHKVRDAQQALREITGSLFDRVGTLREDFALTLPEPASIDHWIQSGLADNLELNARRELVEAARMDIERLKSGHYPSVNLLLQDALRDGGLSVFGGSSKVRSTEISIKLSVPIYEGGLTSASIKESVHRHSKAQAEFETEKRAVERSIRLQYDSVQAGVTLARALKQSVQAQFLALEAKAVSHRAGLITLLPVLDAQRDWYQAKREYEQARYEYLLNRMRLRQLAGALSEADLMLIDQVDEPGKDPAGNSPASQPAPIRGDAGPHSVPVSATAFEVTQAGRMAPMSNAIEVASIPASPTVVGQASSAAAPSNIHGGVTSSAAQPSSPAVRASPAASKVSGQRLTTRSAAPSLK